MKYLIGNAIIENGEIVGYEVIDSTNKVRRLRLADTIKLIETGSTNCKIVLDDKNEKHILFEETVGVTENKQRYTIEYRIIQDGKLSGYKCKDEAGVYKNINPFKAWELAATGCITNAKAKVVNNQIALVGKGISLKDLDILKM